MRCAAAGAARGCCRTSTSRRSRSNPKILLGYSDITALLLPVYAKGRFVTFHGMNGASEWNRFNVDWFRRVLMQGEAVTMTNPMSAGDQLVPVENRIRTITPGGRAGASWAATSRC